MKLKYQANFMLRLVTQDRFLFRFVDLDAIKNASDDILDRVCACTIYLVCKRPTLSMVPGTLTFDENSLSVEMLYSQKGASKTTKVVLPRKLFSLSEELGFDISDHPHKEIISFNAKREVVATTLISNYAHLFDELPNEAKDLEVMYVGMGVSYGALDRVQQHSTLQKILGDVHNLDSGNEVVLLLYNLEFKKTAVVVDPVDGPEVSISDARLRNQEISKFSLDRKACAELAEALLISYFQTSEYNDHFIRGLDEQKRFDVIRTPDFDAVAVELDNENIGSIRVYSKKVEPNWQHFAIRDFRLEEGRPSVFSKS